MKASKNITRSTLWTILSQFPAHMFGILAGIFITRILGPEGKGLYTIFYANIVLFCTVYGFSITNSIVFFTANQRIAERKLKAIVVILLFLTVILSVVTVLIWLNSGYSDLFLPDYQPSGLLLLLFLIIILISQINRAFTAYFQGLKHFKIVNKVLILNGIYSFLFFAVVYFLHIYQYYSFGLTEILIVSLIILVISVSHFVFYYFRHGRVESDFRISWKDDFRVFLQFTGLNHFANILSFFNHRLILWFIAFYLDNWQLGIFSLGIGLAQLFNLISHPLTLVLESFLSAEKPENQIDIFSRFSRIQFTVVLIVCIVAACLSPYLIPWVYGEEFRASVNILNVVLIGIIMSCQSGIISSLFLTSDRLRYNVIASVIGISVTSISAPFLIEKYQLMGAAFSQILTYFGIFLYLLIVLKVKGKVERNLFFVTYSDIKFIRKQLQIVNSKQQKEN